MGLFEPVYTSLGIKFELFEIILTALLAMLLLLVLVLYLANKRKKTYVGLAKEKLKSLEEDIYDSEERVKITESERSKILQQHEEALSKLKEAKEVIVKREDDFKKYTSNFQDDISKMSVLQDELKSYRIKLGELNKEKEEVSARYESEKRDSDEDRGKLKEKFDKDLEAQQKKIGVIQQEFKDEMQKTERAHEKRVSEIKSQTREALLKLMKEKDDEMQDIKEENEKLKRHVEKLKEELRVLEIEKL